MIKQILLLTFLTIFLNAQDILTAQKQNALYIQNLIDMEEDIAENFERYLLTEFKIPTMDNLRTDTYLGSNFSLTNRMGNDISFLDTNNLTIKYAITKNEYRKKPDDALLTQNYMVQLYNRDLYRDFTSVYDDVDITKSYVLMKLETIEAQNIFSLLKAGNAFAKGCSSSLKSTYCNNNAKTMRWYTANSQWIEYDKKAFNTGNITISNSSLLDDTKLKDLAVGSYIFVENTSKYVKLIDESAKSGDPDKFKFLKVD